MIDDKIKFSKLGKYDGECFTFGGEKWGRIVGIGSLIYDGKHSTNNSYYVKVLNHNIFIVGKMCGNGYDLLV